MIDLENIGIKKNIVQKEQRQQEKINEKQVQIEQNTRVVSTYEAPDTSESETLKDFSGLINKFGKVGAVVSKEYEEKQKEKDELNATSDGLSGDILTEEEYNDKNDSMFKDYKKYKKISSDIKYQSSSKTWATNTAVDIEKTYNTPDEKNKAFKDRLDEKLKQLEVDYNNGNIDLESYDSQRTNISKNYYIKSQDMANLNSQQNLKKLALEQQVNINSNDSFDTKIKKSLELGYSREVATKMILDSEKLKMVNDTFRNNNLTLNERVVDIQELNIVEGNVESSAEIAQSILEEDKNNFIDDPDYDAQSKKLYTDLYNNNIDKVNKQYQKFDLTNDKIDNTDYIKNTSNTGYSKGNKSVEELQSSLLDVIAHKKGGSFVNTTSIVDQYAKYNINKAVSNKDLKYLNNLKEIKGTDDIPLKNKYGNLFTSAEKTIDNSLKKDNKVKTRAARLSDKDKAKEYANYRINTFIKENLKNTITTQNIVDNMNKHNNQLGIYKDTITKRTDTKYNKLTEEYKDTFVEEEKIFETPFFNIDARSDIYEEIFNGEVDIEKNIVVEPHSLTKEDLEGFADEYTTKMGLKPGSVDDQIIQSYKKNYSNSLVNAYLGSNYDLNDMKVFLKNSDYVDFKEIEKTTLNKFDGFLDDAFDSLSVGNQEEFDTNVENMKVYSDFLGDTSKSSSLVRLRKTMLNGDKTSFMVMLNLKNKHINGENLKDNETGYLDIYAFNNYNSDNFDKVVYEESIKDYNNFASNERMFKQDLINDKSAGGDLEKQISKKRGELNLSEQDLKRFNSLIVIANGKKKIDSSDLNDIVNKFEGNLNFVKDEDLKSENGRGMSLSRYINKNHVIDIFDRLEKRTGMKFMISKKDDGSGLKPFYYIKPVGDYGDLSLTKFSSDQELDDFYINLLNTTTTRSKKRGMRSFGSNELFNLDGSKWNITEDIDKINITREEKKKNSDKYYKKETYNRFGNVRKIKR